MGFSYGGMVGFKMAEMYADLVESMVFTSCVMALTKSISDAALERIGLKSWSEFLLPDSVQGVKLLLTRATYKLPWIPNFVFKDYLEAYIYIYICFITVSLVYINFVLCSFPYGHSFFYLYNIFIL